MRNKMIGRPARLGPWKGNDAASNNFPYPPIHRFLKSKIPEVQIQIIHLHFTPTKSVFFISFCKEFLIP